MYVPPAFRVEDRESLWALMRAAGLANLVTATCDGLLATPLPLHLETGEGEHGVLYGHVARANPQWKTPVDGKAMAIFMGVDAYVTPSWYATKRETGKVVPTWNYVTIHAYGEIEFFDDAERLLAVVDRLTDSHESERPEPWSTTDAPASYIQAQLRGIVGLRMSVTRLVGKRKMSQNRPQADRDGVAAGLSAGRSDRERAAGRLMMELRKQAT